MIFVFNSEFCEKEMSRSRYNRWQPEPDAKIVGYFSVDGDRNYLPNSSKLKYYIPMNDEEVTLDLNAGIESAVSGSDSQEHEGISFMLQWIQRNYKKIKAQSNTDRWIQPKFVCSRGILLRLFTAPYMPNEKWRIYAGKWKGTIYLRTDKSIKPFKIDAARNRKFGSWGFKFEQYMVSDFPDKDPDTSKPVVEAEEFRCVFRSQIGRHDVLYSTVMKGVCAKTQLNDPLPLDKLKFVELKTSRIIEHSGHEKVLRHQKSLHWWVMGFLSNIQNIVCGFRDENGVVQKLKNWTREDLFLIGRETWQPLVCLNSCDGFLTKLVSMVVDDCDKTIYELDRVSHDEFNITELSPSRENRVLPESFIEETRCYEREIEES